MNERTGVKRAAQSMGWEGCRAGQRERRKGGIKGDKGKAGGRKEGRKEQIKEEIKEFEIRDGGKERERDKHRQRFTLDVVSVFCCFELDGGGSNLVSDRLKRALWRHGTRCLFWST